MNTGKVTFAPMSLFVGATDSGKSTLARRLIVEHFKPAGAKILALDPKADPRFMADFTTKDPHEFLHEIKRVVAMDVKTVALIDEGAVTVGNFNAEMSTIAQLYRELSLRGLFITQRTQTLDKNIVRNCGNKFVFELQGADAQKLAKDLGRPEVLQSAEFDCGEYLFIPRRGPVTFGNAFTGLA